MKTKTQNGNVLFIILIAVALFAALSIAITSSMQGGGKDMEAERAALHATELLAYTNALSTAVSQLRLRGCSDTEISFENPAVSGYENTNAPDTNECHIFHPRGGGLRYQKPDKSVNDGSGILATWYFDGRLVLIGQGSCHGSADPNCKDLKVLLSVNKPICDALNEKIFGEVKNLDFTPNEGLWVEKYNGSYSANGGLICQSGSPMYDWCRTKTFCGLFQASSTGGTPPNYTFFKVLLAR